ncbi:MAG TPA: flagellar basal body rod protein FlgC [Spirochaetota bacterium]|nr:flagellar basal body rod protein FlgC [Spirochaetota bacterium]HPQ52304.1 flagellar basal body rod protein FlgC [Spirochaetota bacterium]
MGMFASFNIASSGLTAQRLRMDVISNNIANATTTRTPEGGAYRRRRAIFAPVNIRPNYKSPMVPGRIEHGLGRGVRVVKIEEDSSPLRLVYDPHHPDAIKIGPKRGYVEMPNVNVVMEMTDLISASRSYEANIMLINSERSMFNKALELGRVSA